MTTLSNLAIKILGRILLGLAVLTMLLVIIWFLTSYLNGNL